MVDTVPPTEEPWAGAAAIIGAMVEPSCSLTACSSLTASRRSLAT